MTNEELTDEEIERIREEERADSIAHGARLVETYSCMYEVTQEDYGDPGLMQALEEATKVSAQMGLEDAGYVAISEPKAEFLPSIFPRTREYEDEGGNKQSVTIVGAWRGTIKGYKP